MNDERPFTPLCRLSKPRIATFVVVLAAVVASAFLLIFNNSKIETDLPEAEIIAQTPPPEEILPEQVEEPEPQLEILAKFVDLFEQNTDLAGWIRIPGTMVDYPVLRSPESDWDFYLSHNFYQEPDLHGVPYIWPLHVNAENDFLFIFSHNMSDGSIFADVARYQDRSFFENHPTIEFASLYNERTFKVAFVFYVYSDMNSGDYYYQPATIIEEQPEFPYISLTELGHLEEFDQFIEQNKAHALYDTGTEVAFGDRMIALWTCASTDITELRLIVVAVEQQ